MQHMGKAVKYNKCFCVNSVGVNQCNSADINETKMTYGREPGSLFAMMTNAKFNNIISTIIIKGL